MALGKSGIKRPRLVSFVRGSKNRREREGRAKEEKRRRRREDQEVWNFDFWYGNCTQVGIYGVLRLSLVNSLSPKARVLVEFILTLDS